MSTAEQPRQSRTHYQTVWLSDLHIGSRGFKSTQLLTFLRTFDCDILYLVGDIFDLEAMRRGIVWDNDTTRVIRRLLKMAKNGTIIYYICGNHDDEMRQFSPLSLGDNIHLCEERIHVTPDGIRLMVIHGDQFDFVIGHMKWLAHIGSWIYDRLLSLNGLVHAVRRRLGFHRYWSLSAYLKLKAKQAVSFVNDFESAALLHAKEAGCQGVVTGHIHTPALHINERAMVYANCGDWVESCTALAQTDDLKLELVRWTLIEQEPASVLD